MTVPAEIVEAVDVLELANRQYGYGPVGSCMAARAALLAEIEGLVKDAERWRAVVGCGRIRVIGWAGFNDPQAETKHLGLELWTRHPSGSESQAIELLTQFADAARAGKGEV
jgi:hypothetical protein